MEIKFIRKPRIKAPTMITAWPGMGNVALNAVRYVRKQMGATLFAEIDNHGIYLPDGVVVNKGVAKFPDSPRDIFYYKKNPPVIFLEGHGQVSEQHTVDFMNVVLDLGEKFKVKQVLTAAGFPVPAGYAEASGVYVASNDVSLVNYFKNQGLDVLGKGQISGLNGLMLGFSRSRGIKAACLLSSIPQYAVNFPNPRASSAIVEVITKILGVEIDMVEIEKFAEEMDQKMAAIENKIKEMFPDSQDDEIVSSVGGRTPAHVLERIEGLFKEAEKDRTKAANLKKELDRWDLYELYEDRFLDLFKKQ